MVWVFGKCLFQALQYLYFLIAVGEEALSLFKGQDKLKAKVSNVKNYIFTVLAAPMALVSLFYILFRLDTVTLLKYCSYGTVESLSHTHT